MTKAAVFTMKLESDLRADFMAEAEASHRPASQVVREMMRDFVQQQRERREHTAFLQRKVDAARISVAGGQGRSWKLNLQPAAHGAPIRREYRLDAGSRTGPHRNLGLSRSPRSRRCIAHGSTFQRCCRSSRRLPDARACGRDCGNSRIDPASQLSPRLRDRG